MPDRGGVAKALVKRLAKAGATALVVDDTPAAEALEDRLRSWLADGPIHGVYWLPALDLEPDLTALDLAAWREALRVRVKLLHAVTARPRRRHGRGGPVRRRGDAPRRPARLRRRGRPRADGRRGHRLREGVPPRA